MQIPQSIEDAVLDLKGLGELVTASEWKRAAIVWAFTETVGRGKMPTNGHLSVSQFANLEISGLTKRDTVAKYRRAWAKAIEDGFATDVKPGDLIDLPDVEWQDYFNPKISINKPPAGKKSKSRELEKWTEDGWDSEKINESERLQKMSDMLQDVVSEFEEDFGTEGLMLQRVVQSVYDLVEDENKVRGVARMFHSLIEFSSEYRTHRRAGI